VTIQDDPFISEILESHVPERREIAPDWVNVLRRAGLGGRSRRLSRRSLLIAFATILVTLIASALAISSEYQWWFLSEEGMGPAPSKEGVVIVARGTWSGHDWILSAYRTTDLGADGTSKEGICVGFLRGGLPSGRGGSMGCGAIPSGSRGHPGELSFVSSPRPEKGLPALVYGPVVASASHVRIEFVDGNSIEAKTIAAPRQLGLSVGFFAVPLPCVCRAEKELPVSPPSTTRATWLLGSTMSRRC